MVKVLVQKPAADDVSAFGHANAVAGCIQFHGVAGIP